MTGLLKKDGEIKYKKNVNVLVVIGFVKKANFTKNFLKRKCFFLVCIRVILI